MDFLIVFNPSAKKQNIEYFEHLVRIASADEVITKDELEQLHRIGKKLGFTKKEADKLISTTKITDSIHPNQLAKRFEQIYEIVKLMLADGTINHSEMSLAKDFAAQSGFAASDIPKLFLLLINGIGHKQTAEELLEVYKKQKKA
jgi:hypothetical protein